MLRLIYTSVQVPGFDRLAFEQLCEQASRNNRTLGVEGLLLCNGVEFMQCLEGPKEAVASIYKKIVKDSRHSDIRLLVSEVSNAAMFEKWSMVGLASCLNWREDYPVINGGEMASDKSNKEKPHRLHELV